MKWFQRAIAAIRSLRRSSRWGPDRVFVFAYTVAFIWTGIYKRNWGLAIAEVLLGMLAQQGTYYAVVVRHRGMNSESTTRAKNEESE